MKLSTLEAFLKKAKELDISSDSKVTIFNNNFSGRESVSVQSDKVNLHIFSVSKEPNGEGRNGFEIVVENKVFFENEGDIK